MRYSLILISFIVLGDQLLKFWIVNNLSLYESATAINGVFNWYYIQNKGASWGILQNRIGLFVIISLFALLYLSYLLIKNRDKRVGLLLSYGLLIGGCLGNLVDRVRLGYVVDMFQLSFIDFPIFNVADVALTLGIVGLFIYLIIYKEEEGIL